jgi:hypothetical protein
MAEVPVSPAEWLKRFLEEKPLLTWEKGKLPSTQSQINVVRIDMYCRGCKMVCPFITLASSGGGAVNSRQPIGRPSDETARHLQDPPLASRTVKYSFQCAGCQQAKYDFWVEIDFHRQAIRKLGQNPPYRIEVEKILRISWEKKISNSLKEEVFVNHKDMVLELMFIIEGL